MDRLVHGDAGPMVDCRRSTDATDESRAKIAQQVAVEIACRHHLELAWAADQLHAGIVDDQLLGSNFGEFGGGSTEAFQEQSVGHLQDVRLVNAMDSLAALLDCQLKCEFEE